MVSITFLASRFMGIQAMMTWSFDQQANVQISDAFLTNICAHSHLRYLFYFHKSVLVEFAFLN